VVPSFLCDLLADRAQEFRGDPQVGGDLSIGQSLRQLGILTEKGKIPFFSGRADDLQQPVLQFGKPGLDDHSKIPVELRICSQKINKVWPADLENRGRFDRFNIYLAFRFRIKAVDDHDPVIFGGKLQVVFHALFVDLEYLETSFDDKRVMSAHLIFGQDELSSFDLPFNDPLF